MLQKKQQSTQKLSGSKTGAKLLYGVFTKMYVVSRRVDKNQGASGIATERPNCFMSLGVTPFGHNGLQYLDGIEQLQLSSSYDCHSQGDVYFALFSPVAGGNSSGKDVVAETPFSKVVRRLKKWSKNESEKINKILSRNQDK
jgi:hypothetical protein